MRNMCKEGRKGCNVLSVGDGVSLAGYVRVSSMENYEKKMYLRRISL